MGTELGHSADALRFLADLEREPFRYDFYQTLRRLECLYPMAPRWGTALRPGDEPVRLGQVPELAFAPAPIASLTPGIDGGPARLDVRLFGLLGPNGPLPIHITEYTRNRDLNENDPTLRRFLDILHHRFIALFYRAWAQAQPHVHRDRPRDDQFRVYVGSFIGVAPPSLRDRDAVPDLARLFHAGILARQVRNAEGLVAIIRHFFGVEASVEEFVGHWLRLGPGERTYLRQNGAELGLGAVVGARVWDHQSKFRIHLGPLTLAQYQAFLPASAAANPEAGGGGTLLRVLVDWVRFYLCFELDWDVRLILKRNEVPPLKLGVCGQLGWTTWLGTRRTASDADDLHLDAEAFVARDRAA